MKTKLYRFKFNKGPAKCLFAILVVALFVFCDIVVFAQSGQVPQPTATPAAAAQETPGAVAQETPAEDDTPKIPNDQLDALVAPIALYPDPLLSQVLVASTYPLELVQLQQWLDKTGNMLNEKAVTAAVQKENWDPSVQAMAIMPSVVKQLAENIKWTSELGNAFLAQQSDVMDAVQRMRMKAKNIGKLQSSEQVKVETEVVESKTVVVIEQTDPEIVYVPSYNPYLLWGEIGYPYPSMYYYPAAYYAGAAWRFGAGIAIGAAWGNGWGWGAGWGNNNINVNINNNFVRHYNNANINRGGNRINNGRWNHNPQHRGGAPYANRSIANRYGGVARGDSIANRQANSRQSIRQNMGGNRASAGNMDRSGIGGGNRDLGNRGGNRASLGGGSGNFGGDRIGSRDISRGGGARNNGSFGNRGGYNGGAARASSNRGSYSMGGRGGGGFGGGRGGGMRGGGGGRGGGRR